MADEEDETATFCMSIGPRNHRVQWLAAMVGDLDGHPIQVLSDLIVVLAILRSALEVHEDDIYEMVTEAIALEKRARLQPDSDEYQH